MPFHPVSNPHGYCEHHDLFGCFICREAHDDGKTYPEPLKTQEETQNMEQSTPIPSAEQARVNYAQGELTRLRLALQEQHDTRRLTFALSALVGLLAGPGYDRAKLVCQFQLNPQPDPISEVVEEALRVADELIRQGEQAVKDCGPSLLSGMAPLQDSLNQTTRDLLEQARLIGGEDKFSLPETEDASPLVPVPAMHPPQADAAEPEPSRQKAQGVAE